MAKFRRTQRLGDVTQEVAFVLAVGYWFFEKDAFDWADWPAERLRQAWQDPEVRQRAGETRQGRYNVLWADVAFGPVGRGGIVQSDADLPAARLEYRKQRANTATAKREAEILASGRRNGTEVPS